MASIVIHLAVAKCLKDYLNIKNEKDYYLGAVAPDISRQIGESKIKSHFLYNEKDSVPNIEIFKNKYPNFKNNDFDLGYFVHLFTDKIWFDQFIVELTTYESIKLLDGTVLQTNDDEITRLIYNDYTTLNIDIIEKYNMDLSLFYEEFKKPNTTIDEIPINKLNILIDNISKVIENSTRNKNYLFDITSIKLFIDECTQQILEELKKDND